MKSSVKKLFALLLAAVLIVSACGKQPAETTAATQQAPAPATETPADKPSDPAPVLVSVSGSEPLRIRPGPPRKPFRALRPRRLRRSRP